MTRPVGLPVVGRIDTRPASAGTPLSSSSTWIGQTFSSLGLTPGTYVWTWGSGPSADPFTLNVVPSSVPEPTSLAMVGIGVVGVLG